MMAFIPPYDFYVRSMWWARRELQWHSAERGWASRPTERRALLRMMLKNWALHEGHYWGWLNDDERQMHLLDLWLRRYMPELGNASERARWIRTWLYPHRREGEIIAIWEQIDELLRGYALEHLSLEGLMGESWWAYLRQHQPKTEHTALPDFALDEHATAMLFDDGLDDG